MGRTALTLQELQPDPQNRRRHPDRNRDMIRNSLRTVGPARSIVIDETNTVLAGNGVVEQAPEAGITKLRVIDAERDELIAVRRRDLTEDEKRQLAMFDNRTAELAEWNPDQLQADHDLGLDLQPFWSDAEQATMFGRAVDATWDAMPEFAQKNLSFRTLLVHFEGPEQFAAFCRLVSQDIGEKTRAIWYPEAPRDGSVGKEEFISGE